MDNRKLAVFDVAGTTVKDDDAVLEAFVGAFEKYGVTPTRDEVNEVMGMAKKTAIGLILSRHGSRASIDRINSQFTSLMLQRYREGLVEEIPGTSETFRRLKAAGYVVALDTGFPRDILDAILAKTGWVKEGLVNPADTVASDEVSGGRPYPYMIFRLMEGARVDRVADVVKVGDTIVDIEEGLAAGCGRVFGVTSGTCTEEQFLNSGLSGFEVAKSVAELPRLLGVP